MDMFCFNCQRKFEEGHTCIGNLFLRTVTMYSTCCLLLFVSMIFNEEAYLT